MNFRDDEIIKEECEDSSSESESTEIDGSID
jgi:hypothetical protein